MTTTEPTPPTPIRPASEPLTIEGLGRLILKESGLEASEILKLGADEKYEVEGVVWEHGKPPPGRDDMVIVALFTGDQHDDSEAHMPGDVRAYVMPTDGTAKTDDGLDKPIYRLYTLNRGTPTLLSRRMCLATFVEQIGEEWWDLAVRRELVEDTDDD